LHFHTRRILRLANNAISYTFNMIFLYQVEHGCTIATIGGVRGILVAGGATGDDVVEFFDWEEQTEWKTIGKMNRGRGTYEILNIFLLSKAKKLNI
jgi:hypothetical protein